MATASTALRKARKEEREPEPIDFADKTCQETTGMIGEQYIRCGAPASMFVKHRGHDEGPYFMCLACGEHNARNRNAYVIARMPEPDPVAIVRAFPNPVNVIRAYVESDFARELATEHERKVQVLAGETAAVVDAADFTRVGELLVDVAAHRREVEDWFKPVTDFAYRLHRALTERKNQVLRPLLAFESTAKSNAQAWQREQDRLRREEEQRLQEEARQREQERLAREAEALEQRGESELAQQVLEQAIHTPAPVFALPSTVPDVKGMSFRERWTWRPIGGDTPQARARAVNLVPREFLCLDEKKLNAYARSHGAGGRIPGLEFYDAGSVAVRG